MTRPLVEGDGPALTATAFPIAGDRAAFGFEDGTVRIGSIGFNSTFMPEEDALPEWDSLGIGEIASHEGGIVQRTPENQLRLQQLEIELGEPIDIGEGSAIKLLDLANRSRGYAIVSLTADNRLGVYTVSSRRNLLTGKTTYTKRGSELPYTPSAHEGKLWLGIGGLGDTVYLTREDGHTLRYDARNLANATLVETLDLLPEEDATISKMDFLLGRTTLLVGDTAGRVGVWFPVREDEYGNVPETEDGITLARPRVLQAADSPITAIGSSQRTRVALIGDAKGNLFLYQITTGAQLGQIEAVADTAVQAAALAPKDDGLLALAGSKLGRWSVDLRHPEATLSGLFMPIWYEGSDAPEYVWQSSSGTDDFEMKLGLVPLIFGTLKATLYSMLFGAPLALLAAIYTSEFLHPKAKARIKPTIELMASLPSVVLGFLAALVIAPAIEDYVPETLTCVLTIPFFLLVGSYLWQMLPVGVLMRAQNLGVVPPVGGRAIGLRRIVGKIIFAFGGIRIWLAAWAMMIGLGAGFVLGPATEQIFFAGDIKRWLDGQIGGGWSGWAFMLLPLCGIVVAWQFAVHLNPRLRDIATDWSRQTFAMVNLVKFIFGALLALLLAVALGVALNAIGFDPRGGMVGTYVQRNAMIVGFVMGFAIVPIIYTIAEDALSAVPEHLRAASLATGATPWQTAVRVTVPVATSGLFSALMIGLGRAVGETMIVLMAAGNTPVLDLNIFNGFRTLSANIAVELPEAVKDSTHYRTLFLAALTLFAMTFAVNTFAEAIRLHFRKKNKAL